jgi:hypothetical protein
MSAHRVAVIRLSRFMARGLTIAALSLFLMSCSVHVTVRDVSVCSGRQACLAALQETVESYWRLPACARAGMKTTLGLVLPETGPVAARIVASSGYQEFDEAALVAARLASGDIATRRIREGLNDGVASAAGDGHVPTVQVTLQAARDGDPAAPGCAASFVWRDPPVMDRRVRLRGPVARSSGSGAG